MTNEPVANILIVDDDTKTLVAMEALLAGPGRKIVRAESGNAALRCLLREDFVLVLLDGSHSHRDSSLGANACERTRVPGIIA